MFRSLRRPRRGVVRAGALALAFASFIAMSQTLPARADDDRDAAANAAAEAQATVNALQSQLEGIDASLAQVYIDLQNLNAQIPEAQTAYDNAVADYDKKSREHTTILGELSAAKGEQTRIDDSLNDATTQADDSQRAIADLVRRKYREGNVVHYGARRSGRHGTAHGEPNHDLGPGRVLVPAHPVHAPGCDHGSYR